MMSCSGAAQGGSSSGLTNLNLLLALDDDPRWLRRYETMARRAEYRFTGASSVAAFAQAYLAERPSLIVIDLILGDADCSSALDFLVRCRSPLPLVISTGFNQAYMQIIAERCKGVLNIVGLVEKKRNVFQIEDLLLDRKIPPVAELISG